MKDKRLFSRDRPARALASVMALILAGCGGGPSASTGTSEGTPAKDSSPQAAMPEKSNSKNRTKNMAPGGDMGVRERRAANLKERAEAKK